MNPLTSSPRLPAVDPATATGKSKDLLAAVHASLGITPNMMRTMANSPAVLDGYLSINEGEIAEIPAHVAINVFTNYFNKAALTVIDFPKVESQRKAA